MTSTPDGSVSNSAQYKVWNTDLDQVNTVKLAPVGLRLLALGIDFVIVSLLYIVASFIWPSLVLNSDRATGLLIGAILFIVRSTLQSVNGCSFGQKIFGIRIASANGMMWQEAFLRNLVSYVLLAIPFLGLLNLVIASARTDSRGIHDMAGKTSVVKISMHSEQSGSAA